MVLQILGALWLLSFMALIWCFWTAELVNEDHPEFWEDDDA